MKIFKRKQFKMKTPEAEQLNRALKDQGLQLKHLSIDSYMDSVKISKSVKEFLTNQAEIIQSLIDEYNKEYFEKVKSQEYKDAILKKESEQELTSEEKTLTELRPTVEVIEKGIVTGPQDFLAKIKQLREDELKDVKVNFISDASSFKKATENATIDNQITLYKYLFKE
jgi:hypothetical protein